MKSVEWKYFSLVEKVTTIVDKGWETTNSCHSTIFRLCEISSLGTKKFD